MKKWFNEFWENWNEAFLFPVAILIFAYIYIMADHYLGYTGGLQPLGYYVGPLFIRPAFFLLAGFMATLAFRFNKPVLYNHTARHIRKVLNPVFQAWGTDKKEENLKFDDRWAIIGHFTWLALYGLALFILALAAF